MIVFTINQRESRITRKPPVYSPVTIKQINPILEDRFNNIVHNQAQFQENIFARIDYMKLNTPPIWKSDATGHLPMIPKISTERFIRNDAKMSKLKRRKDHEKRRKRMSDQDRLISGSWTNNMSRHLTRDPMQRE